MDDSGDESSADKRRKARLDLLFPRPQPQPNPLRQLVNYVFDLGPARERVRRMSDRCENAIRSGKYLSGKEPAFILDEFYYPHAEYFGGWGLGLAYNQGERDLEPLQNIRASNEVRAEWMPKALAAHAGIYHLPECRRNARNISEPRRQMLLGVSEALLTLTLQRVVAELPGLSEEQRDECKNATRGRLVSLAHYAAIEMRDTCKAAVPVPFRAASFAIQGVSWAAQVGERVLSGGFNGACLPDEWPIGSPWDAARCAFQATALAAAALAKAAWQTPDDGRNEEVAGAVLALVGKLIFEATEPAMGE